MEKAINEEKRNSKFKILNSDSLLDLKKADRNMLKELHKSTTVLNSITSELRNEDANMGRWLVLNNRVLNDLHTNTAKTRIIQRRLGTDAESNVIDFEWYAEQLEAAFTASAFFNFVQTAAASHKLKMGDLAASEVKNPVLKFFNITASQILKTPLGSDTDSEKLEGSIMFNVIGSQQGKWLVSWLSPRHVTCVKYDKDLAENTITIDSKDIERIFKNLNVAVEIFIDYQIKYEGSSKIVSDFKKIMYYFGMKTSM